MASKRKDEGAPVLNLKIDSANAEPRDVPSSSADEGFQTPCSLHGLMAGLSGGSLGYLFGFGGYWLRHRTKGQWKLSLNEGWGSAKTFAIMGGIYAAVGCFMRRLRQKEDAWNGAASGCATGLVLGWGGGPVSAAQSCALLGLFSYFVDGMSAEQPARAAALHSSSSSSSGGGVDPSIHNSQGAGVSSSSSSSSEDGSGGPSPSRQHAAAAGQGSTRRPRRTAPQHGWQANGGGSRGPLEALLSPAVPLLAALTPCRLSPAGVPGCHAARQG